MALLAAIGKPWISFFSRADMSALLSGIDFSEVEDLSGLDIDARWFKDRTDGLMTWRGSHLVRARV